MPTVISIIIGTLVIVSGALMSFVGYNPEVFAGPNTSGEEVVLRNVSTNGTYLALKSPDTGPSRLKALTYIGPVFMGIGFFVMMVAAVLYCEIKDKYVTSVLPRKDVKQMKKEALYDMIIEEFRKNYFRGIELPIRKPSSKKRKKAVEKAEKELPTLLKALSMSQPALMITPDVQRKWHDDRKHRQVPSTNKKRKRPPHISEHWLKTSSLPNIRSKPTAQVHPRVDNLYRQRKLAMKTSKSCDDRYYDTNIENNLKDDIRNTIGVDNPAFRTSPTEKTPQIQISPPTSPETSMTSRKTTDVIVHIQDDANDGDRKRILLSVSDSESDNRGFTQRRLSENDMGTSCEDNLLEIKNNNNVVSVDDVTLQSPDDNEHASTVKVKLSGYKSEVGLDYRRRGPYKTFIGIFRSESGLDKIRKLTKTKSENDADSLDSLTLSDDLMKNFEMTVFSEDLVT